MTTGRFGFFASTQSNLVENLDKGRHAVVTFVDKGHDVFAMVHGTLSVDTDLATIDRSWNSFVAAWYEGGKTDPKLRLLRLDPHSAEIWLNESSIFAGLKMLLGADPKADYQDKVGTVALG